MNRIALMGLLTAITTSAAHAAPTFWSDETDFVTATGATSLTGPLPNLVGSQGTSLTLGDATLTAGGSIFVGEGWSTLLENDRAIAISGDEDLSVEVNSGLSSALGFYFHEPAASTVQLDGCNAVCVDSTFRIDFLIGGVVAETFDYTPPNDVADFLGVDPGTTFDAVRFTETVGGIDNEFYGEMFTAAVAPVPAPAGLGLLGAGLLGLGFVGRRSKRGADAG